MKAVFYHRPDSIYNDDPALYYHFPFQYLSRVRQTIGDFIVYYGPVDNRTSSYWGIARVLGVRPDSNDPKLFYADVEKYLHFDRPLANNENGGYERRLIRSDGTINSGRAVQAVRLIEEDEFNRIVVDGLSGADDWPDRNDSGNDASTYLGFGEEPQRAFDRPIVELLTNRPFRDRKFTKQVRKIYDRTCALTGLRLINGLGRPEVEAAHIIPVEENGPDSIRNGIALSATVHWMFDRGLLSLANDFTILKSRHLNHDISHLLRSEMKALVPKDGRLQPHPYYLDWHRTNRFKA